MPVKYASSVCATAAFCGLARDDGRVSVVKLVPAVGRLLGVLLEEPDVPFELGDPVVPEGVPELPFVARRRRCRGVGWRGARHDRAGLRRRAALRVDDGACSRGDRDDDRDRGCDDHAVVRPGQRRRRTGVGRRRRGRAHRVLRVRTADRFRPRSSTGTAARAASRRVGWRRRRSAPPAAGWPRAERRTGPAGREPRPTHRRAHPRAPSRAAPASLRAARGHWPRPARRCPRHAAAGSSASGRRPRCWCRRRRPAPPSCVSPSRPIRLRLHSRSAGGCRQRFRALRGLAARLQRQGSPRR